MKLLLAVAICSTTLPLTVLGAPVTGPSLCTTSHCQVSAAAILQDLHASADPCEDFSEFACGGYYRREKLKEGEQKNNYLMDIEKQNNEVMHSILTGTINHQAMTEGDPAAERLLKKLQEYYGACMDQSQLQLVGREALKAEIQKMKDVYPVTGNKPSGEATGPATNGTQRNEAVSKLLGYNMKHGFENPFVFELWDDENRPGYKIMAAQQAGLGLTGDGQYSDSKVIQLYEKTIGEMLYIIEGEGDYSKIKQGSVTVPDVWKQRAKDIVAFEKILAGITDEKKAKRQVPESESSKPLNNTEGVVEGEEEEEEEEVPDDGRIDWDTVDDLNELTPFLDWHLIFKTAFPEDADIPTELNMLWKFYLRRMDTALQRSNSETIQGYFTWTMIRTLGKHLSESIREPLTVLEEATAAVHDIKSTDRSKMCINLANENVGQMAGHFFIKATFPEASRKIVQDIIGSIRWTFEKNFWQYDWLDPKTRQNALQKLKAILAKVGSSSASPDVSSAASVDEYYRQVDINAKDHFGNQVRCSLWKSENFLRSVTQSVNRLRLDAIPQTVNAYYNPTGNAIEILAGILRPPFFHPEVPEYLNFAGIGSIVAHEMGHGFDNNGRRYDETGAVRDWWTEETAKAFDDKSQCFIEQYNEFTVKGPEGIDHYVNGWRTLGENIADNGGLKTTFEAWRQRYQTDNLGN
ncbi:hypothetical protein BGW38_003070, partial [Lunasporangiospora selenospora]